MRGNITRRGKSSWRIKFDAGTDDKGKRLIQYETVQGTRKQAEAALAKRLTELAEGRHVARTVETVETYARHWIENIAPATRSAITLERYNTLLRAHIIPGLGSIELQKLDGKAIDAFYATRRARGLASYTLSHINSLLAQILKSAVKAKKLVRSPQADIETKPKLQRKKQIVVLTEPELADLLAHLKDNWLYMPSLLAASTGMRRGEVLGLRWQDVDFAKSTVQVTQAIKRIGGKLIFGPPKNKRSFRTVKIPTAPMAALERHRKEQLEQRLKLGLGGRPELVFTNQLGQMIDPDALGDAFVKMVTKPGFTFHGLRHTHATLLLKGGVPVHIVSARIGHSKPSITLDTYCHLLGGEDNDAAREAEAILLRVLK